MVSNSHTTVFLSHQCENFHLIYPCLTLLTRTAYNLPTVNLALLKVQLPVVSLVLGCPQGDMVDVVVVSI